MNYTKHRLTGQTPSVWKIFSVHREGSIKSGRNTAGKNADSPAVRGNEWFRHSQSKGGYPVILSMGLRQVLSRKLSSS